VLDAFGKTWRDCSSDNQYLHTWPPEQALVKKMGLSVEPPSHVALITNPSRHDGAAIMTSALPLFISHGAHGIDCSIGAACCMFCILECIFSAEDFHEPQGNGDERMAGRVGQIMDAKIELSSGACAMYSILVISCLRTRNCTFIPSGPAYGEVCLCWLGLSKLQAASKMSPTVTSTL